MCFWWADVYLGLPGWLSGKESTCQGRSRRCGFSPWMGKIPWRRKQQSIPVFFPEKSHGQKSLAGLQSGASQRVGHDLATKQQEQHVCLTVGVELLGHKVCVVQFQQKMPNNFPNDCANFYLYHPYTRVPIALYLCQHLPLIMPFLRNEFSYFSSMCIRTGRSGKKRIWSPVSFISLSAPETFQAFHLYQYCHPQVDYHSSSSHIP